MIRIFLSAAAVAAFGATMPAHALSIVFGECMIAETTGQTVTSGGINVFSSDWPGSVVTYTWVDSGGTARGILQHCPSNQYVAYAAPRSREAEARNTMEGMAGASQSFSMDQLIEALESVGASAARGRANVARCACDYWGH